ncbi:ROK family transcriptional regulator [Clostridium sediminicola]|uniref:ROK family transcriptional regulator n=1 Tax=Clostridium sediminicola TaxID=3114879 RepID=UPI0031F25FE9
MKTHNPFYEFSSTTKKLYSLIQKNGPFTKGEILDKTGLKLTTVNRAIKPLLDYNLIQEVGIAESSGGRKPLIFGINTKGNYVIGIDLSRTYIQVVITDFKMNVIGKRSKDMTEDFSPDMVINYIGKMLNELKSQYNIKCTEIIGAGVGTVGPLDKEKGIMINPKKFPSLGWEGLNIKELLQNELGLPVVVDNGANSAVFAEQYYGVGKGFNGIAYFNCGIGIRTGVVASNKIIRTHLNYEDTFAHMVVDMDGEKCSCGKYGCVEAYATIAAIFKKFIKEVKKGKKTNINTEVDEITYKDICNAAENGDELSREILRDAATVFGIGLANYINILSPEIVILSGPLIQYSNYFYQICVENAESNYTLTQNNKILFSKQGKYKQDAISVGAAATMIEEILN